MLFITTILAAFAAFNVVSAVPAKTSSAAPAPSDTFDPNKSCPAKGPFALKIASPDGPTYNNHYITQTHIGAGIGLAVVSKVPDKSFYLNYTSYSYSTNETHPEPTNITCYYGVLQYTFLPNIPFTGGLNVDIKSNIAQLWLSVIDDLPGSGDFEFTKANELTIGGDQRWFGCNGTFEGYGPYPSINWEFGTATPSAPCVRLTILKA